jgi:hypothetical protein
LFDGVEQINKILKEPLEELDSFEQPSTFVLTFAEVGQGRQKVRRARQVSWRAN